MKDDDVAHQYPLATKGGIELIVGLLFCWGALCPKCGFGTRVTSKRWAKCKRCGEKVKRNKLPESHRLAESKATKERVYDPVGE